jgi:imidazolonepropionase-like amidohydrolase
MVRGAAFVSSLALLVIVCACAMGSGRDTFVSVQAPQVALEHVDLIDGSGAPVQRDVTVVLTGDRIAAVGPPESVTLSADVKRLDLRGHTVIPGLVGMHDHLFYAIGGGLVSEPQAFARLYLASGVTSIRTTGSVDGAQDRSIKQRIESGREAGPRVYWSGEYLDGHKSASEWNTLIDRIAANGATSLKAYTAVRHDDLAAIIAAGHRHNLVVTGHLCAVGFREAAALGIDNLEHGLLADSEIHPRKPPDECPDNGEAVKALAQMDPASPEIDAIIRELIQHHVAVTSTLAVFDTFTTNGAFADPQIERFLTEPALNTYRENVGRNAEHSEELKIWTAALQNEMAFERRFVDAGGLLAAGADPTGWGGTLAGLADQRNVELLSKAGFSPETVIQIATSNGASLLRARETSGLVQPGKAADLVVLSGDLTADIRTIRNVRYVFLGGLGFSPVALIASVLGHVGAGRGAALDRKWLAGGGAGIALIIAVVLYDRVQARKRRRRRSGF